MDEAARRVEELLADLTTEERASLTGGRDTWHLPAIERVGLGRLKMSDGPSGIRGAAIGTRRSTAFPCGMAVGATWDVDLVGRYGTALAEEAVSKGVHVLLGPTVGIPRTPLGGRTFESFSEDPRLTAELTVAYVRAVQAGGVACCVKHFACNDQEHERMTISAEVDERALREIHLVPFEEAVIRAGTWSVMSAYNRLHGTFCGEHPRLLGEVLKGEWGFDGVVVSDWFGTHSTVEATLAGLDVEMPGPPSFLGAKLAAAVEAGEVPTDVLEEHTRRILLLADRTGLLDGRATDEELEDDDPGRRALARELAVAATVLLRNDGLLPLPADVGSIAVIGPNAELLSTGGGGSSQVLPHRHLSFVDELGDRFPSASVVHEPGCLLGDRIPPIDPRLIAPGLRFEVVAGDDEGDGDVLATENLSVGYMVSFGSPLRGRPLASLRFRATGALRVPVSGRWRIGIANAGLATLFVDGEQVVDNREANGGDFFFGLGFGLATAEVDLEAGREHELVVELDPQPGLPIVGLRLHAAPPAVDDLLDRAVGAAAGADVAVVVVGASGQTETEGFDRPDLRLAGRQDELVSRVVAANPRTLVVVNAGAPVEMPWAGDAGAVAVVWYPGEEGAPALADIVAGRAEPAGRLPITFPARLADVPTHGDNPGSYPGADGRVEYGEGVFVGYRHYDRAAIDPAYCFGHGLGYTTLELGVPEVAVEGTGVRVVVPVTNTGGRAGSQVVQVYVRDVDASVERPEQELAGFAKVTVEAGATGTAEVVLDQRVFSFWDEGSAAWRLEPGAFELRVGTSSRAIHHTTTIDL